MFGTPLLTFALSQFFGLYMLIIGVVMLIRARAYRQMVQKMDPQSGTLLLGGLIGLMLGMFFVGIHNIWVFAPIVLITMLAWLVLILSVLCLTSPERMVAAARNLFSGSGLYWVAAVMAILGVWILARGVYIYATHSNTFLV